MINPGTPHGVPVGYDCSVRKFAWEFGKKTLPSRGEFRTLFEALQLQHCNITTPTTVDVWSPPKYPTPASGTILYVDPDAAAGGDGSIEKPFCTLSAAVTAATGNTDATIMLRAGVHYSDQIHISPENSGLTIQNYNGEHAVLSGGLPIDTSAGWKRYTPEWLDAGERAAAADTANIWSLDLSASKTAPALPAYGILGLRVNGKRAIRAKYPNGNPEISGGGGASAVDVLTYKAGWITEQPEWVKPKDQWNETKDVVVTGNDWPGELTAPSAVMKSSRLQVQ
jgi:hypothetical protein